MILLRLKFPSGVRNYSTKVTGNAIREILENKPIGKVLQVQGWVKAVRRQKEYIFVDVDDGSCSQKLQVMVPTKKKPPALGFHTSVSASGMLQVSTHQGQDVELLADTLEVVGESTQESYPFKARRRHPPDYVRQYPHLRARTNTFSSLLRVRSQAKMAMHQFFNSAGFINVDTPILTSNNCEGGGDIFTVEPPHHMGTKSMTSADSNNTASSKPLHYFGCPVYLTVSGQLHLEAVASGMSKVYNFNPAFRAENSQTRRHLAEFWMVEAEEAFLQGSDGLQTLMDRIEALIKSTIQSTLDRQEEDVLLHWKQQEGTEEIVQRALLQRFVRLPYKDAIEMLKKSSSQFKFEPAMGKDLAKEHEFYLTNHFGNLPVFVIDWPKDTKAFYMCAKEEDPEKVLGVDLLMPLSGEVAGGGLREYRLPIVQQRLEEKGLVKNLSWYSDLRKLGGGVPSGGFGIGFERLLQFLLGVDNIKDTIPFPRWSKHCSA